MGNRSPKCIVWDFDATMLRIHAYRYGIRVEPETGRILSPYRRPNRTSVEWRERDVERDFADPTFFKRVVAHALSRGMHIAVASFGERKVILAYLRQLYGDSAQNPFEGDRGRILTPASLGQPEGGAFSHGKRRMIALLMEEWDIKTPREVIFFDDSPENVQDTVKFGVLAYQVPTVRSLSVAGSQFASESYSQLESHSESQIVGFHRAFWAKQPELVALYDDAPFDTDISHDMYATAGSEL